MKGNKRILLAFLAIILLIGGTGAVAPSAHAASCTSYHTVRAGESLSWIGRYYGVNWRSLASLNNIRWPYTIYPGQRLCISTSSSGYTPVYYGWSYVVSNVVQGTSVTIQTSNFPDNVLYEVSIGKKTGSTIDWKKVSDLDSGRGGKFKATFDIPTEFASAKQLHIRLTHVKKSKSMDRWFTNSSYQSGTGGMYTPWYGSIPTIWIVSVVRDTKVTFRTNNFPAGVNFDVFMGPMGSKGIGGIHVGTFNSGSGGTMEKEYAIPAVLYGSYRIAIRTQNLSTGFYSYNWFYNNSTH